MTYRPYKCGNECNGGYYCLICLLVHNFRVMKRKLFPGKKT